MTDPGTALDQLIEQAARLRARLVRIRGRGESLDGQVRVEVDAEGDIVELTLSSELHALHLQDVATAVADAHRKARAQARTLAADIHRELCADPNIAAVAQRVTATEWPSIPTNSAPPLPTPAPPPWPQGSETYSPVSESGW